MHQTLVQVSDWTPCAICGSHTQFRRRGTATPECGRHGRQIHFETIGVLIAPIKRVNNPAYRHPDEAL